MTATVAAQVPSQAPAGEVGQLPGGDVAPNPTLLPQEGIDAVNSVLSLTMWVVLSVLMLTALTSIGFAVAGKVTGRPQVTDRGLTVFGYSLGGAVLTGIAIPLVTNFYNLT